MVDGYTGQAKSMMFMHISPEDSSRGETLSTLNFGSRVSQITLGQVMTPSSVSLPFSTVVFQASKNVEKGSSVAAVDKLKKVASAKDEKIVELQRVIESERACVRKAESDKQALERELRSLRVPSYPQTLAPLHHFSPCRKSYSSLRDRY